MQNSRIPPNGAEFLQYLAQPMAKYDREAGGDFWASEPRPGPARPEAPGLLSCFAMCGPQEDGGLSCCRGAGGVFTPGTDSNRPAPESAFAEYSRRPSGRGAPPAWGGRGRKFQGLHASIPTVCASRCRAHSTEVVDACFSDSGPLGLKLLSSRRCGARHC